MYSHLFIVFIRHFKVFICKSSGLLRVERTVAVHQINRPHAALAKQLQRCVQIRLVCLGNRHDIYSSFIPLLRAVLDHGNRSRNRVDIGRDAHQINRAILFVENILFVIASAHISHDADLHIRLVFSHNGTDILIVTEFPLTKLVYVKHFFGRLVTKLHIIHTGPDVCTIQRLHKLVRKAEIIYQTAIPQRAVHHLDIRRV